MCIDEISLSLSKEIFNLLLSVLYNTWYFILVILADIIKLNGGKIKKYIKNVSSLIKLILRTCLPNKKDTKTHEIK